MPRATGKLGVGDLWLNHGNSALAQAVEK